MKNPIDFKDTRRPLKNQTHATYKAGNTVLDRDSAAGRSLAGRSARFTRGDGAARPLYPRNPPSSPGHKSQKNAGMLIQ
jgi:hypothetical protein